MAESFEARFRIERNEETGEVGAVGEWFGDDGDAFTSGAVIAHDTLEHGGKGDASIAAELRAIGSLFWLRWESCAVYMSPNPPRNSADESIANEFIDMFRHFVWEDFNVADPSGREDAAPLVYDGDPMDPMEPEIVFRSAVRKIRDILREEFSECGDDVDEAFRLFTSEDMAARFLGWLRVGYRDALRRFGENADAYMVYTSLFDRIAGTVDAFFARADEDMLEAIKARLVVHVDPDALKFRVTLEADPVECWDCEGYGKAEGECPDCFGYGWEGECPACEGGIADGAEGCDRCEGEGVDPCTPCKGTGERERVCPTCDGACEVPHPDADGSPLREYSAAEGRGMLLKRSSGY